ncbi:MAG: tripartite tricarboxylate transporter substrate binding protein [Burkholderiales bacterium]|nr:tripartite tricarboxylate transporter substrate binding protein [Burkholderiales bacterium]
MSPQRAPNTLELVIGFSPGSASDIVARLVAPLLAARLDQPVQVIACTGSSGARAAAMVAAHRGSAELLIMATLGTHAVLPSLRRDLDYRPLVDFIPIALLARSPMVLGVSPGLQVESVQSLVEAARAAPGTLRYGSSAIGGAPHLAAALFERVANVRLRHVPFARTTDLYADLASGRIDLSFNNAMSMLGCVRRGSVRGLAVTGPQRLPQAPQLPALVETGLSGCVMTNWLGLAAPAGIPDARIAELNAAVLEVLRDDELRQQFSALAIAPAGGSSRDFAAHIATEIDKWSPIVKTFASREEDNATKQ